MSSILFQVFVYLCAAVIAVPIAKRLGLGSVLGYLIAGVVIGPFLGLVGAETRDVQHFAEFGVVMMLFLVGLELEPKLLWRMRNYLLGLGGLQVIVTIFLVAVIASLFGQPWRTALAIGMIFSLSSTAIVLQTLSEKGLVSTEGGRSCFSVLLFQDIAVIFMLAIVPLLLVSELQLAAAGTAHVDKHSSSAELSLVAGLSGWAYTGVVLATVSFVIVGGIYLSRPVFRFIAQARLREIFTATALLLVIGIALLMTLVELSPALGTFLAGVVLANSEFRHELETDIEPFKGLLLGLFFITVGAGINFAVLFDQFPLIFTLTISVLLVKGSVLFILAKGFGLSREDTWLFALGLAQVGEFGFVLIGFSVQNHVLPESLAQSLLLVVSATMLLTPLLFILYDKFIVPRYNRGVKKKADDIIDNGTVIIAGVGRFGQIVNRLLLASGVRTVVLDHEASMIERLRTFGIKSYYGDASQPGLLEAAGIQEASVFVVTVDDRERAIEMVQFVRRHYPKVTVLARAFDVNHLYLLKKAGAHVAVREVFDASIDLGNQALKALGIHPFRVKKMSRAFRQHDLQGLEKLYEVWDQDSDVAKNKAYVARAKEHIELLKSMMEQDRMQLHDRSERSWTPPPKPPAD